MPRELKNAAEIKTYFQSAAAKIIGEIAGDPIHAFENVKEFQVMTKYGRMTASTHDSFIACRFDSRNLARPILNGMSSKWNHHAFGLGTAGKGRNYADAILHEFASEFARIEPRKWETHDVIISEDEMKKGNIDKLRDREAMGERLVIEGFDHKEASEEMVAEITDNDGNRPDWLVNLVQNKLSTSSPLEVYISYNAWRKTNPKPEEPSTLSM